MQWFEWLYHECFTVQEDKEIVENGASLRMTLYLKSPHTFKGPIAKSNKKSGFRSGKRQGYNVLFLKLDMAVELCPSYHFWTSKTLLKLLIDV